MSAEDSREAAIRAACFERIRQLDVAHNGRIPRSSLEEGITVGGTRVPFVGPQGIFKPSVLRTMPLSITTSPVRSGREPPYEDGLSDEGFLTYKYRGTDPGHRDNRGLRQCLETGTPLVYFYGVRPGTYLALLPVRVVRDDPTDLSFSVSFDETVAPSWSGSLVGEADMAVKAYRTSEIHRRLHQRGFRERVLMAYADRCAICSLRHPELLDAAHIVADSHPKGLPVVPNGLSLCKIHHAAFDANVLGVRPDCIVEIRQDVLKEKDGPMLKHGLQDFHGSPLLTPRSRIDQPDADLPDFRYQEFSRN